MKNSKKMNRYQLSIITLLAAGLLLIAGVWFWFEMKNNELNDQLKNKSGTTRSFSISE